MRKVLLCWVSSSWVVVVCKYSTCFYKVKFLKVFITALLITQGLSAIFELFKYNKILFNVLWGVKKKS